MASLSLHGKVIGTTFVFLLLFGLGSRWAQNENDAESDSPVIAFEHGSPVTFFLTLSMRGSVRIMDVDHTSKKTVFVSVPQDWRRTEVRGVPLSSVTAQPPGLGFVRYTLPPHAGISFRAEGSWEHIMIENPRHVPMTLKLTTVDGDKNVSAQDVILLKDEVVRVP